MFVQSNELFSVINRIMSDPEKQIPCVLGKEGDVENPEVPDNVEVGLEIQGVLRDLPEIGQRFNMVHRSQERGFKLFSTSPVVDIIYATDMEVKFRTQNSIYLLVTPK
ncbi:MAG: hypothetical protein AABY15_00395 [Nanoarchaeota archaeon]